MITIPEKNEYGEYYERYISIVNDDDIGELLLSQIEELRFIIKQIPEEKLALPYSEGKWTYKQLLGHINDTEKIMFYRALCIARGETRSFPGFDQDLYTDAAEFNEVLLSDLIEDFGHIRHSVAFFLKNLSKEAGLNIGKVNGQTTSVRALLYIIPGHFKHHMDILNNII